MTKAIVLGDTHWGANNDSTVMHSHFEKFYKELFEYVDLHKIKHVIQTGDLFDKRKAVNFLTLQRSNEQFFKPLQDRGMSLYVIAGNHDCTYKNTNSINSVNLLVNKPQMYAVTQYPATLMVGDQMVDFFPWVNESNIKETLEKASSPSSKIAVGHFEFSSFPMYPGIMADAGMNHKLFEKYTSVYSGHYHTISTKDNIVYTGIPYELTWGDYDDPKGFWVVDLAKPKNKPKFIENKNTLFVKIQYDDSIENGVPDVDVENKYVKVYVVSKNDQYQFDSYIANLSAKKPYNIQVIDVDVANAVQDALAAKAEFKSTIDMINHVVDQMDMNVDKQKLKTMITEVYSEAMEMVSL